MTASTGMPPSGGRESLWLPPSPAGLRTYLGLLGALVVSAWAGDLLRPAVVVPAVAALATVLAVAGASGLALAWYGADEVAGRAREIDARRREQKHALILATRRRTEIEMENEHATVAYRQELSRIDAERNDLPTAQKRAEAEAREDFRRRMFEELDAEETASYAAEGREQTERLHALQRPHIQAAMQRPLAEEHIEGIEPILKQRLIEAGIVTPAGITPRAVSLVTGFGPHEVSTLVHWRDGVEAAARRSMPAALPDADRRQIGVKYEAQRDQIRATRERAEHQLTVRLAEIAEWHARRPSGLDAERLAAERAHTDRKPFLEEKLAGARSDEQSEEQALRTIEEEYTPYRAVSFRRYLQSILLGSSDGLNAARERRRALATQLAELTQFAGSGEPGVPAGDSAVASHAERAGVALDIAAGLLESPSSPLAPHVAESYLDIAAAETLAIRVAIEARRALVPV
ncbi:MAG TPA: hypothetical protein VKX16_11990 [Chloroflexota bacterium]|nr:hypothetical protein [Chloroflexota bacterium]